MQVRGVVGCVLLMACSGVQSQANLEPVAPSEELAQTEPAPVEPVAQGDEAPEPEREHHMEKKLAVRGIEGSMSSFDVNATMERQNAELAACQARAVPALTGVVVYGIQVDAQGTVHDVTVQSSDLGDRALERCVSDVIARTAFPRPNGGAARFTWTMTLEPASERSVPEAWEREQIERVLEKNLASLHEECGIASFARHLGATAYVNKKGRVVAAGVTGKSGATDEHLDCVVLSLRKWRMPKPKQRFAKVSFSLVESPKAVAQKKNGKRR